MIAQFAQPASCCAAASSPQELAQIFAFGLLMSAGHCLGMCGPLVCAASLPAQGNPVGALGLYHAGRIASYALLGALLGGVGSLMPEGVNTVVWQAVLSLLAAAALVWVALGLLDIFPLASPSCAGKLSRWMMHTVGGTGRTRTLLQRFGLGAANGVLPCGPVYTVAVAALAAGGPARGALAMVVFGAGTLPLLVGVALGMRWAGQRLRLRLFRAGAALALLMGVQLALRGMAALEWVPHARFHEVVLW
ncbi:MAG: sulfite exporter TauE/SafE family protein [Planctomycetes bacterium]|nr:sulfite exporter TauE/SafE family protein [Planctomycetota bacterium]